LRRSFFAERERKHIPTNGVEVTPLLHCLDCGACCQARDGTILIVDDDLEKWRKEGYDWIIEHLEPGHFGQLAFKMTEEHRCVFQGTFETPYACRIYGHRATICRTFEQGCPQCFDIRRNQRTFETD
jgi:Fe-S-cluster containining protein